MTRDVLTRRLREAIDRRADEIVALGEQIWRHPELGFKETKQYLAFQRAAGRREVFEG